MENEGKKTTGNKLKIIIIAVVVVLVLVAAIITAVGFSKKNNLYESSIGEEIGYGMPMEAPLMEMSEPLAISEGRAMNLKDATYDPAQSMESEMDDFEPSTDKKVIKNGNLNLTVDRVSEAQEKISEIAKSNGGDVFSSNIRQTRSNIKSGNIAVKVPVENFEKAFDELKEVATLVVSESTSGTDVTEEYQDLEVQINNKQAEEQSYIKILDRAEEIDDVLAVTRQITRVRGEIERLQGRLKYLASQTDMSTINISLSEDQDVTITDSWRPLQVAKDAINSLVKSSQGFINFIIVLVITVIPVAILYLVVIYIIFLIIRKIYRKIKKKREDKAGLE